MRIKYDRTTFWEWNRTLEQDINSFFMDFDLADIDCKIRIISRKFLKKHPDYIPKDKDHGIYILVKNNLPVYVGQSFFKWSI